MRAISAGNRARIKAMQAAIARLPAAEQVAAKARVFGHLAALLKRQTVVAGDGDAPATDGPEWDLWLANWLDRAYQPVAERVEQVASKAGGAITGAAAGLGSALLPLAFVVLLVGVGMSAARSR